MIDSNLQSTREVLVFLMKYVSGKVLDFGSGRAKYKKIISTHANSYTAFDMFPGSNVDVVGNALDTPFSNNEFDTIISTQVLEHVAKPWLMIKEIGRILKPGGRCLLTMPFLVPYHPDPQDNSRFTTNGLILMFKDEGFEVLECGGYGRFFTVLSEFMHFVCFDPYKKSKRGSAFVMNFFGRIAKFLDRFVKNDKIYANVFI